MDTPSPRPPSPGAEIYRDRLQKSCQNTFCHRQRLFHRRTRSDLSARFGKSCLGDKRKDCCHGLRRKAVNAVNVVNSAQIWIYPRRSDPFIGNQQQPFLSFFFSKPLCIFSWNNHIVINFRILDFLANILFIPCFENCNLHTIYRLFCFHCMFVWFDCAFSWDLGFIFLRQKLDNWIYTTEQGLQLKVRRDRPTQFYDQNRPRARATQIEPGLLKLQSCLEKVYHMMAGWLAVGGGGMINSAPDIIRDTARATPGGHLDSPGCWVRLNIVTPSHRWDLY